MQRHPHLFRAGSREAASPLIALGREQASEQKLGARPAFLFAKRKKCDQKINQSRFVENRLLSRISERDGNTCSPERRWPRSITFSSTSMARPCTAAHTAKPRLGSESTAPISVPTASAAVAKAGNLS